MMDNLKRRDFLKLFGTSVIAPIALSYPKSAEAVELPTEPLLAIKEKSIPIIEPETGGEKPKVAGQPTAAIEEQDNLELIFYKPNSCCCWRFGSLECGYKGNDIMCFKTFGDCKTKGNETRFGGFPPTKKERNE